MIDVLPSGLDAVVDQVVPLLRRRCLFPRDYTGDTLRAHLGLLPPPRTPMTSATPVNLTVTDSLTHITLNRPEHGNSLTYDAMRAFIDALGQAHSADTPSYC
ncbi:hypothetical protein NKH77_51710 [Streptomyces sp. M19]